MPPKNDGVSWDEYRLFAEREFDRLGKEIEAMKQEIRNIATEQTMSKGKVTAYGVVAAVVMQLIMSWFGKYL